MQRLYDEILEDISQEDGLVVLGHGLNSFVPQVRFAQSVLVSAQRGAIIVGLLVNSQLASRVGRWVRPNGPPTHLLIPRVITSEYSVAERKEVYESGGFLLATARILVHDFLRNVIPAEKIAGIVVNDAHRVTESSAEAFVLRLYRERNKRGFIKSFTEHPEVLSRGFHNAEKMMRNLFVQRLFLWPRFHEVVQDVLDERPVDVVEINQPMTTTMLAVQRSILDCISACLNELRESNKNVDIVDLKVEDALFRSFYDIIKRQLDPVWHLTGARTRQLVEDLRSLRQLLTNLHRLNCIEFYELLESHRHAEGYHSTWLMTKGADGLFNLVRSRVFRSRPRKSSTSIELGAQLERSGAAHVPGELDIQFDTELQITPVLEPNPKWKLLREVLDEVDREGQLLQGEEVRAVIFVRDELVATQLHTILEKGDEQMLHDEFEDFLRTKSGRLYRNVLQGSSTGTRARDEALAPVQTTLTQIYADDGSVKRKSYLITQSTQEDGGAARAALTQSAENGAGAPHTLSMQVKSGAADPGGDFDRASSPKRVRTDKPGAPSDDGIEDAGLTTEDSGPCIDGSEASHRSCADVIVAINQNLSGSVKQFLDDLQPSFVIIYDPMLECIRQVELYKADHPGKQLRVYFLVYENSAEYKRYLYTVQKEQEAFENLIREKATMIVHANQEGRNDEDTDSNDVAFSSELGVGRTLGVDRDSRLSQAPKRPQRLKIIVDVRELRSSLCGILHGFGMELLPYTLPVGDYVLSPSICVERKSIPDLISSFNSGRLFSQVEKMTRYYRTPCLLLEFELSRPFSLVSSVDLDRQISITSIVAKTAILTQKFPQLRLLWCRTPYETAQIFQDLKADEEEPDEKLAAQMGIEDNEPETDADLNIGPLLFLRSLPGITARNIRSVLDRVSTVRELVELSEEELVETLGGVNGRALFKFLNTSAEMLAVDDAE